MVGGPRSFNLVLNLVSGSNFPLRDKETIKVRGGVDETWNETTVPSATDPIFNTDLVWKIEKSLLGTLRSNRKCVRIEVSIGGELLGHQVLDLRTAKPVNTEEVAPPTETYRLIGAKERPVPELEMALTLEEDEEDMKSEIGDSSVTDSIPVYNKRPETLKPDVKESSRLTPQLVEDADPGYFIIGPPNLATVAYTYKISIVDSRNLELLIPPHTDPPPQPSIYSIQSKMLGKNIDMGPFSVKESFVPVTATTRVRSCDTLAARYFASTSLPVTVSLDNAVIGLLDVDLGRELVRVCGVADLSQVLGRGGVLEYSANLPVPAAYNMTVPKDGERAPELQVAVIFSKNPVAAPPPTTPAVTGQHDIKEEISQMGERELDSTVISQGMLSDTETEETTVKDKVSVQSASQQYLQPGAKMCTVSTSPLLSTQISASTPPILTNIKQARSLSPPTRLPRPEKNSSSRMLLFPGDETDPTSPPTVKQPRLSPPSINNLSLKSPTQVETARSYKFSVELTFIQLAVNCEDLVLSYRYEAFHPNAISTSPGFRVAAGTAVEVPRGYCQFSFSVTSTKLVSTFSRYPLKISLRKGEDGARLGLCTVKLDNILHSPATETETKVWREEVECVSDQGILGRLSVSLELKPVTKGSSSKKRNYSDLPVDNGNKNGGVDLATLKSDMLSLAARELEQWKHQQKTRFAQQLKQAEMQQLNLLGREWKERELEREERMQRKLEEVAAMKQELQESLAELDKERTAVKQREQELAREKGQVEEEGKKVKEERGGLLDKLKAKLRTVESELEAKTGELSGLREKVRAGEAEISRLRVVAGGKKQQERGTGQGVSVEAARLKSENQLLKSELLAVEADRDRAVTALASANQQLSSWQLQGQERQEKKVQQLEETVVGLQQEISRIRKSPSNSSTPRKLQPKMELDEIIEVERVDKVVKMVELVEERSDSDGSGASGGLSSIASGKQKRIRGLERDRDTLLRTGNYSHDDYIVRAMQEKIDKLKEKPDGL